MRLHWGLIARAQPSVYQTSDVYQTSCQCVGGPSWPGGGRVVPEGQIEEHRHNSIVENPFILSEKVVLPERLSLVFCIIVTLCRSRTKGILIYLLSIYLLGGRQSAYKNILVSCNFCACVCLQVSQLLAKNLSKLSQISYKYHLESLDVFSYRQ